MKFDDLSTLLRAAMIATPLMFAAACGDEDKDVDVDPDPTDETDDTDDTDDTDTDTPAPTPEGKVKVLHFAEGVGNVDVFANEGETPAFSDLAYLEGTAQAALPAADYSFQVSATGETAADALLTVDSFTVAEDGEYTFAAIGDAAPDTDEGDDFAPTVIAITSGTEAVGADQVEVTVIHAGVGIGEVDIYDVTQADAPALLVEDLSFGESEALGLIDATERAVGIDVDNDPATMELLFGAPFNLVAGQRINVFAVNDPEDVATLQVSTGDTLLPIEPGLEPAPTEE
jgi:hypothetical protein